MPAKMLPTMPHIKLEKRELVAIVKISRPEKLNTLSIEVIKELTDTFINLRSDPETRSIIITGDGEKAFAAGADIKELSELDTGTATEFSRRGQDLMNIIEGLGKPTIAVINGYCFGGGCELALSCSLRIASEDAKLGQPEVKLGIITGFGGSHRLVKLLGKGRAAEICLFGEPISALKALEIGLVNRMVKKETLLDESFALAKSLCELPPIALKYTLAALNNPSDETERKYFSLSFGTEDMKEGTKAFLEKRKPSFKGK